VLRERVVAAVRLTILPEAQIGVAILIILASLVLMVLALLRYTPWDQYAIAKTEPFWVLLLSIAALLYAGLSALPAALAYREASKLTPD
jgi:hypothetical protein